MPWAPRKTVKGACTPVLATLRDRGGGGPRVPPPDDFDEEREANYNSIIRFGQRAFPHWIRAECSQFHRHVDRTAQRMLKGPGSHKRADMAPRANAKSTWISNVLPIWIAAHAERLEQEHDRLFRCILIISYAISLPSSFVRNIRRELEGNDYLARYYPEIHGEGGDKWTQTSIRTKNGIWIIAGAIGGNLRGKIEESHRPELTVLDDTESAEQAQTLSSGTR